MAGLLALLAHVVYGCMASNTFMLLTIIYVEKTMQLLHWYVADRLSRAYWSNKERHTTCLFGFYTIK